MSRPCSSVAFAVLAVATAISAQQTWVVDSANGPGTHFTDLPPAEAAARSGDTIRVRSGTYSPFVTSKGLRILGEGFVRIDSLANGQACVIRQIPAGQSATLSGFFITPGGPVPAALRVENCQGRVHLEQILVEAPVAALAPAIDIDSCSAVTLASVTSNGVPAIRVRNSEVAMQNSRATGQILDIPPPVAFPAAVLDHARLTASNCHFNATTLGPTTIAAVGIQMTGSVAAFTRGLGTSISASPVGVAPTPGIFGTGTVFLDPGMPVVPLGNAPRVLGVVEVPFPMPGQWLQRNANVIWGYVTGPAGSPFVTLVGRPGNPTATPFPDQLWLDPGLLLVVAAGVLDFTERAAVGFAVPGVLPPGTLLGFQTVGGPMNDPHLSPPAVLVTR